MNVLSLPWPPSLNSLFADGKHRRIRSKRYDQWLAEAACALSQQRWEPVEGSCRVRLFLTPPTNAESDADNYIKAPLDFLVSAGVIEGDSRRYVRSVLSAWTDAPPKKPGGLRIEVEAA